MILKSIGMSFLVGWILALLKSDIAFRSFMLIVYKTDVGTIGYWTVFLIIGIITGIQIKIEEFLKENKDNE